MPENLKTAGDGKTFIAPCADLATGAAFGWLAKGWKDYWSVARISLTWGLLVFLVSALMSLLALKAGGWVLLLTLLTGFVFVAPVLAFALYSVSRQLDLGETPSLRNAIRAMRRPVQNAMVFGLVLLIIFLIWARAGSMVHIFFPMNAHPGLAELGVFFLVGSLVGSVFATVTFASTAFSLPMLANRDVDVVTAVVSSIHAVLRNKKACAVWAALIVLLTVIGVASGLLGLIIVIPWLAYSSWHAYQETLDVSAWPTLPEGIRGD